jgi:hypothetical protein
MARWKEDAEEARRMIEQGEPTATVSVHKRFLRHEWFIRVVRDGVVSEYEDVNHYWLEQCLVGTFCRGDEG